jgi:hypothetical protein
MGIWHTVIDLLIITLYSIIAHGEGFGEMGSLLPDSILRFLLQPQSFRFSLSEGWVHPRSGNTVNPSVL